MIRIEKTCLRLLLAKNLTIAAAESASAGYASYLLTKNPGSSKVFKGAAVVYSLGSKQKLFHLDPLLLESAQGVSGKIVKLLAMGTKKLFVADIGIALVGFAGPQSCRGHKAGTMFLAVADKRGCKVKKVVLRGSRDAVRKLASVKLLELAVARIKKL